MSSPDSLWTWPELCRAVGVSDTDGPDVSRVIIDSRQAQPGDLVVALRGDPGERFNPSQRSAVDGHDYVAHARANGAVGALVESALVDGPELLVADSYDGLWSLGYAGRERLNGAVVGVTGSSGKTTFKAFMREALDGYAPPGSLNNHIGVPLSLANAPAASRYAVIEIGTNHPGEIAPLTAMARPTVGVVLNVQNAHIGNFDGFDALLLEKLSLINQLDRDSKAVCEVTVAPAGVYTFGNEPAANAYPLELTNGKLTARVLGDRYVARVPGGGEHRAQTLLAVLLTARLLEADMTRACDLADALVPSGRGDELNVAGITLVDDSYNANPASMTAAIDGFLAQPARGRRIAVFGQMAELGAASAAAHAEVAAQFTRFDHVIAVGAEFSEADAADWFEEADADCLEATLAQLKDGDRVLVKGSNAIFWTKNFVKRLVSALETR